METTVCFTRATIGIPYSVQLKTRRPQRSFQPKRNHLAVVSILTPSTSTNGLKTESRTSYSTSTTPTKNVYKDTWIDRLAINYLSKAVQDTAGVGNAESGYDSLVVAAGAVFRSFDPIQQRQIVVNVLQSAVPAPVAFLIKKVMPPSKFSREYFAAFTTIFFPWLVGPCEVKESEFDGRKEKNVVHVTKCRFLESTNCAGMCTNLCKIPSQEFIKNSFGIPINMVPNFDDMSCEMIFGQEPPPLKDDPVLKQPCYKLCNVKNKHDTNCVS